MPTKDKYKHILQHQAVHSGNRLIRRRFIFQQDNDPKHTNNAVIPEPNTASENADSCKSSFSWRKISLKINEENP